MISIYKGVFLASPFIKFIKEYFYTTKYIKVDHELRRVSMTIQLLISLSSYSWFEFKEEFTCFVNLRSTLLNLAKAFPKSMQP
jgi:hypothetical protein